ncbi:MAG: response regulator [Edaphobacter sp.]
MPVSVLVIDDDALSREVLTLLLDAAGYIAEEADSGEAAISQLQSANSIPQVILTDLQMLASRETSLHAVCVLSADPRQPSSR